MGQQWLKYSRKVNSRRSWSTCKETPRACHLREVLKIQSPISSRRYRINFRNRRLYLGKSSTPWRNLDSKILDLVDDENEEESIEHEVAEASEIIDEITRAVVRIDSTPKSLQINSPITLSTSTGNVSLSPQSATTL